MKNLKRWATNGLHRGDFSALSQISRGNAPNNDVNQIDRLLDRSFVRWAGERTKITLKGRVALLIRRLGRS